MQFGDLTYLEIRELIEAGAIALWPTGCTEQQGPHLPVDYDTFWISSVAETLSEAAQEREGLLSLVVPTMPFGPTPEHRNYGTGFIDLPQELYEQLCTAVLQSLADQGFTRVIWLAGCGGHHLLPTIEAFNRRMAGRCYVQQLQLPLYDIWCRLGDESVEEGHADSFTTAIALHLRPESVRRELIYAPHMLPVPWDDPKLDFSLYSDTGVVGDPTYSSSELGAQLWEEVINSGLQSLMALLQEPPPAAPKAQ
ncbi:MAG: creatininase family protein [Chloroflexi bacterium]|nr:creatininase family protein [Chloroflexota bacterium]